MNKYLADLKADSTLSTTAIVKKDDKGVVSIKLMGYADVIKATPIKPNYGSIEHIEMIEEKEDIDKVIESMENSGELKTKPEIKEAVKKYNEKIELEER